MTTNKNLLLKRELFNKFVKNVLLDINPKIIFYEGVNSPSKSHKYKYTDAVSYTGFKYKDLNLKGEILFYTLHVNMVSSKVFQNIKSVLDTHRGKNYKVVLIIFGLSKQKIMQKFEIPENIYVFAKEILDQWISSYPISYIQSQTINRLFNHAQIDKIKITDFLNNNKQVIDNLNMDIKKGNLSIALGAGVSYEFGAPSWKKLIKSFEAEIDNLLAKNLNENLKSKVGSTELIHAQLYKDILNEDKYFSTIYSSLYSNYLNKKQKHNISKNKTLYLVARLINRYSKFKDLKIISYNYDDFLEQCLEKYFHNNINFEIIYEDKGISGLSVPIYHVHGFLPFNSCHSIKKYSESIKLTEDDYYYLYNNPYSWQIVSQLDVFRNSNCLFIGCSLTDPNIRRLLKLSIDSKKRHYAIMSIEKLQIFELIVIEKYFQSMGVNIIWINNHNHKNYKKILNNIYN